MKKILAVLMLGVFLVATPVKAQEVNPNQALIESLQQQIAILLQLLDLMTQLQAGQDALAGDVQNISNNQQSVQAVAPQTQERVEVTLSETANEDGNYHTYSFKIYIFDQNGLNTGKHRLDVTPVSSSTIQMRSSSTSRVDSEGKYYYLLGFTKERFNAGRSTETPPDTQVLVMVPELGISEVLNISDILVD